MVRLQDCKSIDDETYKRMEDEDQQWRKFQELEELKPISQLGSYFPKTSNSAPTMATSSSISLSSSDSGSGSVFDTSEEKTNGTRLARLLIDGGTYVLRKLLDSVYPEPKLLAKELKKNFVKFQNLKSKRVIIDHQWEKLFPPSGLPDSKKFDITLLHLLIREVCYLPAPLTGWHKMPADNDQSLEANIARIKCFRNELCHSVSTSIPNEEFEDKWNTIASSLEAIKIGVYRKKIQALKNDSIDHKTQKRVDEEVEKWQQFQEPEDIKPISQLESYFPDIQEPMFGRSQELQEVVEIIEGGTFRVVLITGGPGFGKTTLAIAVAHELVKSDDMRKVLFCRLLSKKTFNEVAIEMIHLCGKSYAQPPEYPDQWLKDWSRQMQMQVTFVLDNADDILESKQRSSFLDILREMTQLSEKKLTFVITSREQFKARDLLLKEVVLSSLSTDNAKEVLISRVTDEEIGKNLSRTEELVKLCGRVPLALCIVGSLLSDYTEERLVNDLDKEPMKLLDDGNESIERVIKTSFDLLSQDKQDSLVLMSIFPGSFDSDAAVAVISRACSESGTLPVYVLRCLKNSSLVEQPSPRRHQLHPLIRAFGKKIGQTNDPQIFAGVEKLACAHFICLLAQNAKIFWSKDQCKKAIDLFSKDRHNFEHFLQVYAKVSESCDEETLDNCKEFLQQDFLQNCMYLEKCLSPSSYTDFLEALLSRTDPKIKPVRAAELLCLRGHEKRKVGDKQNDYQVDMKDAYNLYSENSGKFETNTMSAVFLLNSYADSISKRGDPANNPKVKEINGNALELSKSLEKGHPERAEALLLAGRFAKRRREWSEAERRLQEALELFQNILGTHLSTVHALKEMADFYFSDPTENELEKALTYYKRALEMMKQLGMENNKAIIMILNNYGLCSERQKGNFQEAEEGTKYLERAYFVADRELQPDHQWKVKIKTHLALLYEKDGKEEDAIASMQEALKMCNRLNKPVKYLGNKHRNDVTSFLKRHKEYFPQSKFPR